MRLSIRRSFGTRDRRDRGQFEETRRVNTAYAVRLEFGSRLVCCKEENVLLKNIG